MLIAQLVAEWLEFFYRFHREKGYAGAPVHDAVAVAALAAPELFTVEEMHEWLNKETVDEMLAGYYETVEPYLYAMPDYLNLQHTREEVESILATMGDEVEENYANFVYDFEGGSFTYDVVVSRYPDMRDPLFSRQGLSATEVSVPREVLGDGEFYWRVTATRSDGQTVPAMNQVGVGEEFYPGVYSFVL